MRGKLGQELGRDGLAVEPLLQHVEGLHAALAHDQQFAVDRAVEAAAPRPGRGSSPRCPRRCANRAGDCRVPSSRGRPTACTRMPSHFHSARKSAGSSAAKSASSIACASIAGRNGAGSLRRRLVGAAFEPGEQLDIGRRAARARSARSPAGPCRRARPPRSWRAAPRRRPAAPPVTSLSSAQRPVSSSASSQRASWPGSCALPSVASVSTTSRQRRLGARLVP